MIDGVYSIKAAAKRTGLTSHVIRVWEKRYAAVRPSRTPTNRRLYSDADVERLELLRDATIAGHSIGRVAQLSNEELSRLRGTAQVTPPAVPHRADKAYEVIEGALKAVSGQDSHMLEQELGRAVLKLGTHGLLERVVGPLAQRIGDLWRDGTLTAAHEHMATAVIKNFLAKNSRPYAPDGTAPVLVVGTPPGQLHELGAVMAASGAGDLGWRVVYLGTSLPAAEIAGAAVRQSARAVALSIVYPEDDPAMAGELASLRSYLPPDTAVIVGGRAAEAYDTTLKMIGAHRVETLKEFYKLLETLRRVASHS